MGTLGGIRATWRYRSAHELGSSISPEGGRRLLTVFQRNAAAWGSDADLTLAYHARIRIRLGFAVGLDTDGVTQAYLASGCAF